MTAFSAGDVIWVPFPHVENERMTVRPALVVSDQAVGPQGSLLWAIMITNALRPDWPDDVPIDDHQAVGLPHPSKIRTAKIATLEAAGAEKIGRVDQNLLAAVQAIALNTLGEKVA